MGLTSCALESYVSQRIDVSQKNFKTNLTHKILRSTFLSFFTHGSLYFLKSGMLIVISLQKRLLAELIDQIFLFFFIFFTKIVVWFYLLY